MRYGFWMPVFGGWLRNVEDEAMETSWEYVRSLALRAEQLGYDLTLIADKLIKQKLENAKGVGQVRIVGGAKREIHVLVDPDKLRAYNLTITDVFNALKSQNLELPGGSLKEGAREEKKS